MLKTEQQHEIVHRRLPYLAVAVALGATTWLGVSACATDKPHAGSTCQPNDPGHWESNGTFDAYYTQVDAQKYAADLRVGVAELEKGKHGVVDCHTTLAPPDANGAGPSDIGSIVSVPGEGKCVIEDFPPDATQALVFCGPAG